MLKQSQKRMKRHAFCEALKSRQPAITMGLEATIPTVRPFMRAKQQMIFGAYSFFISKIFRSSTML